MSMIIRNHVRYASGGNGGDPSIEITQAEYDELVSTNSIQKDVTYYITDSKDEIELDAAIVKYDNTESGLEATDVQSAIDEVDKKLNSFQNGVDSIVQACTDNGSTPESNTPNAIIEAINSIGNSAVEFLSSPVVKNSLSFNDSVRTISYTVTEDDAGYYLAYGYAYTVSCSTTGTTVFNLTQVLVAKLEAGQSISITGSYGSAYSFIYKIA